MESLRFGIQIRVNDLDQARIFYRELLGLGAPAANSTFAVEFEQPGGFTLRLESSKAAYLEHASAAVSWMLEVDDLAALREKLADAGYPLADTPESRPGGTFYRGLDPEGNVFWVAERTRR